MPSPWASSLYWRIGVSFVLFVVGVILAQNVLFTYQVGRLSPVAAYPNELATEVAAAGAASLVEDPSGEGLGAVVDRFTSQHPFLQIVLRDGRTFRGASGALAPEVLRFVEDALAGTFRAAAADARSRAPVVTAPIQVDGRLVGMVVLPPPPAANDRFRNLGVLLTLPGTLLLVVATVMAAFVIFAPARRRLAALEAAADRMGRGDLTARAPESGRDEVGRVARAFNTMGDELAARDAELRASNERRRQMLADVSHELKTPLTAMRGYIETLQMPELSGDADRRASYLATIARETRRLERLVADLVDLARYENDVIDFEPRVCAIERVFQHVALRHEREAGARGIAVELDIEDAASQVVADPGRLEQVVDNLVANALRYTPAGGRITMRARAVAGGIQLTVENTGDGIPPEHLPRIFDRFYKADPSRAAAGAGSGLGLAISKAIVERHGGSIDASSAGGLTVFRVVLPQAHQAGGMA